MYLIVDISTSKGGCEFEAIKNQDWSKDRKGGKKRQNKQVI